MLRYLLLQTKSGRIIRNPRPFQQGQHRNSFYAVIREWIGHCRSIRTSVSFMNTLDPVGIGEVKWCVLIKPKGFEMPHILSGFGWTRIGSTLLMWKQYMFPRTSKKYLKQLRNIHSNILPAFFPCSDLSPICLSKKISGDSYQYFVFAWWLFVWLFEVHPGQWVWAGNYGAGNERHQSHIDCVLLQNQLKGEGFLSCRIRSNPVPSSISTSKQYDIRLKTADAFVTHFEHHQLQRL